MRMAEEFARCKNCGEGWFDRKEQVLIEKASRFNDEPLHHKTRIAYSCSSCGRIQYQYEEENN